MCRVQDISAAFAAVSALPQLQHLNLYVSGAPVDIYVFPQLQLPLKLTYLCIEYSNSHARVDNFEQLSHLSALVDLRHLDSAGIPSTGYPGGWPNQLTKLTNLRIDYRARKRCDVAEQFQHLSCLTALQRFSVSCVPQRATRSLPGIQHLPQLTCLVLDMKVVSRPGMEFSTAITCSWPCRTALKNLVLQCFHVQPQALAALTQLRWLYLYNVTPRGEAPVTELLRAVSSLTQLTGLYWHQVSSSAEGAEAAPLPAAAFTALTASTNLRHINLFWHRRTACDSLALFQPGCSYPYLRGIDLAAGGANFASINEQQLQLLCSCCPVVEDLAFVFIDDPSPTAWLPLLQLSALTQLRVCKLGAAVSAAVSVVAQLTVLKDLSLQDLASAQLSDPALLQLTALQALTRLVLASVSGAGPQFHSQVRHCDPPDVWIQLLRHLLRDAECRQALLKCCSAAAAAPIELMLAQLAATLAEELAAGSAD